MWRRSVGIVDVRAATGRRTATGCAASGFHQPSAPAFGLEPLQVDHHLERPAIALAQVHDRLGRILRTTDAARQMRDITHRCGQPSRDGITDRLLNTSFAFLRFNMINQANRFCVGIVLYSVWQWRLYSNIGRFLSPISSRIHFWLASGISERFRTTLKTLERLHYRHTASGIRRRIAVAMEARLHDVRVRPIRTKRRSSTTILLPLIPEAEFPVQHPAAPSCLLFSWSQPVSDAGRLRRFRRKRSSLSRFTRSQTQPERSYSMRLSSHTLLPRLAGVILWAAAAAARLGR